MLSTHKKSKHRGFGCLRLQFSLRFKLTTDGIDNEGGDPAFDFVSPSLG